LLMEAMLRQQTEYFNLKITLAIQASWGQFIATQQ
jgi:hypothetical protein